MTSPLLIHADPSRDEEFLRTVWRAAESVGLNHGHLFHTSGASGGAKWVHLTSKALEISARAVIERLGIAAADRCLRALPAYHVAGYQVGLRAQLAGAELTEAPDRWDAERCAQILRAEAIQHVSLVPTQLVDLVRLGIACPPSLRTALIGGGALAADVAERAISLGWPIIQSYGMTEAGSTIATALPSEPFVPLPIWQCAKTKACLTICGPALMTGYLEVPENGAPAAFHPAAQELVTTDRIEMLADGAFRLQGRADAVVKVLGELVDTTAIEALLPHGIYVVALPDERAGHRLVAVGTQRDILEAAVARWNKSCLGFQRLESVHRDAFPLSSLGKLRRQELINQLLAHE